MRFSFLPGVILLSAAAATPAFAQSAAPFQPPRDPAAFDRALECLTQAIYYEARSESEDGQRAVAQVVLNRVRHPSYPNTVCGVVYQGSERSTGCQFTFTCDGSMYGEVEPYSWDRARRIATAALRGNVYRPVGLALNYHTTAIRPYWAPSLERQAVVGAHIFYRRPGSGGGSFSQAPSGDEPEAMPRARYASARSQPSRLQVETPVLEIPVYERPVRARTLGGRGTPPAPRAARQTTPVREERPGPRVTIQGGVRVVRGS